MSLTVGGLFAGYGGLEMGLASVLDTELAWYAEFDKAPAAIMAHHHPDVPNLGDVTKVDWASVRARRHHHRRLTLPGRLPRREAQGHEGRAPAPGCGRPWPTPSTSSDPDSWCGRT